MVQEIFSGCKNVDKQAKSSRPKTVDSEAVLQTKEANLVSNTESIRQTWYLKVQCGLLPWQPHQKHTELPNYASQNFWLILKLLLFEVGIIPDLKDLNWSK